MKGISKFVGLFMAVLIVGGLGAFYYFVSANLSVVPSSGSDNSVRVQIPCTSESSCKELLSEQFSDSEISALGLSCFASKCEINGEIASGE